MNLGTRSSHSELEAHGASTALRLPAQAPGTDTGETLYETQARSSRLPAWENGGVSQFLPPLRFDLPVAWIYSRIFFFPWANKPRGLPQREVTAHLEACQEDVPVTLKISLPLLTNPSLAYSDGPVGFHGIRNGGLCQTLLRLDCWNLLHS